MDTLPQYFLHQVRQHGRSRPAVREKELGIWQEFTWAEAYEQVRDFALGLLALGVGRGEHVATVGDNDRWYLWGYLAIQAIGAVQVGLYTDAIPDEMATVVARSDAVLALAQDQEQCDKFLAMRPQIPKVRRVIYWDEKGLWGYDEPWLLSFDEVRAMGRQILAAEPERFETEAALGRGEDTAVISYTSGATGEQKGAMLSHANLIATARIYHAVDPRSPEDDHVSFVPLGWIGEHALGIAPHVYHGLIVNFPEAPETVRDDLREIAPQVLMYGSRLWESLVSDVQVRIKDSAWLNRKLYDWFLPVGERLAEARFGGERPGWRTRLAAWLGEWALFRPLRDQLGLTQVRAAYTAGAVLSPAVLRFFHAIGVNLKQVYGVTEMTGGVTMHRTGEIQFASVGRPLPETEVRISEEGEILLTGSVLFQGYYKDEAATEAALVEIDGRFWFRTGDAGYFNETGHLIYLDRLDDMLTLATGEKFSPQFIESRLKFSPYVRDAMAIGGEERPFVTAIIIIDFANVGHWAEERGIGYTTFLDLSQQEVVYRLVETAVRKLNDALPPAARVRRFALLHKAFDADEAEMTRSRKLRRHFLYERYAPIIEGLYDRKKEAVPVRATVQYQDGSEGVVETAVRLATLKEGD